MNLKNMKTGETEVVAFPKHPKDELLRAVTYENLIITLQSNEQEITPKTVEKVFKEILEYGLQDAKDDLKDNMAWIIKEATR